MKVSGSTISVAVVGVGKIARDQHIPTIAADPRFRLAATVTRHNIVTDIPNFATLSEMKAAVPEVSAVAICTPPRGRLALVREAMALDLDVLLEKPPAATLSEAEAIAVTPGDTDAILHVTWHSREAPGVEPARAWLAERRIRRVQVTWAEDVRIWHPGQEWIWEPGIGVFDPGINALSILTRILPGPLLVERALLSFPENKAAPIAAELALADAHGAPVEITFDFDRRGPQCWTITVETDDSELELHDGGAKLSIGGMPQAVGDVPEYARLYDRFATLIAARASDVDLAPFRLVADAFAIGERRTVAAFEWERQHGS